MPSNRGEDDQTAGNQLRRFSSGVTESHWIGRQRSTVEVTTMSLWRCRVIWAWFYGVLAFALGV